MKKKCFLSMQCFTALSYRAAFFMRKSRLLRFKTYKRYENGFQIPVEDPTALLNNVLLQETAQKVAHYVLDLE